MSSALRHALVVAAAAALMAPVMPAEEALATAREIAAHFTPKGGTPVPVLLEAVVIYQDPAGTIYVGDDTGATFINAPVNPKIPRGERLRITGISYNGLFIGGIKNPRIDRLGSGAPLPAREITPDDLASGKFHYQWVTLGGVGRSVQRNGESTATLRLIAAGRNIEIRFDEAPPDARALVDAEIRVRGLAAGDLNDHRQLVQPYIRLGSIADLDVLKPPPRDPFAIALTPTGALQHASEGAHRVKIRGVALALPMAGGLFLRDEDRSVFVQTSATEVKAGDQVEALGFPDMGVFSAQLSDAECRVMGSQEVPAPRTVTGKELADGCDADLVTLEARVLQRVERHDRTELLAQTGKVNLMVYVPGVASPAMAPDALLRVTGVCRVSATRTEGYRARPLAYEVWPRFPDDVAVVHGAPWWTSGRLAIGLGTVALLALGALAWAGSLRRQVARQLAVIEAKAQREAIMEERQRIAREFHDTLEQELAGLSLRLDAATPRVGDEKARALLEQQQRLLQRLQTETRDFVWDLRDVSRQDAPLDEAVRSLIEHLQVNTPVRLKFETDATGLRMPALVQHHLLRITREAVHNAIKYARATGIAVSLLTGAGALRLRIADDGGGFDADAAAALDGHFGIRGMKERARKIGADLRIRSATSRGTEVALTLALPLAKA